MQLLRHAQSESYVQACPYSCHGQERATDSGLGAGLAATRVKVKATTAKRVDLVNCIMIGVGE